MRSYHHQIKSDYTQMNSNLIIIFDGLPSPELSGYFYNNFMIKL